MTVPNQIASVTLDGNGVTTVWQYPFLIPESTNLTVTITDTTVTPNVETILVGSLYTVSGAGNPNGGTVTYPLSGSPLAVGFTITIARSLLIMQDTSIENQGDFYPMAVEDALDYLTMLIQDQQAEINALQAEIGSGIVPVVTPTPARVASTSGTSSVTISASDAYGLVIIEQTTTSDTTVYVPSTGGPYAVMDGNGNFGTWPVKVQTLTSTIFSNGVSNTTSWIMAFGGQSNSFTGAGGKMWVN